MFTSLIKRLRPPQPDQSMPLHVIPDHDPPHKASDLRLALPRPEDQPIKGTILTDSDRPSPDNDWVATHHPLQQVTIRLLGTRQAARSTIVDQLDEVLRRLLDDENGDAAQSNDVGYAFMYKRKAPGASFFDIPPNERTVLKSVQEWAPESYPLQQVLIHLQGTRLSERSAILGLLEQSGHPWGLRAKLLRGDSSGSLCDDDFGYAFEVSEQVAADEIGHIPPAAYNASGESLLIAAGVNALESLNIAGAMDFFQARKLGMDIVIPPAIEEAYLLKHGQDGLKVIDFLRGTVSL